MKLELDSTSVCRLMIACHLMKKRWQEEAKHDPSSESWQQVCKSALKRWDDLHDDLQHQLNEQPFFRDLAADMQERQLKENQ